MAERIKKSIPWFLVIALFGLTGIFILNLGRPSTQALTELATTSVSVGNDAPTWTAVYEWPASATNTPTNVGSNVVWEGRADDPNGDEFWLVICTSSAAPATSSAGLVPTCAASTWATSTAADNATATASRTALVGDAENNAWWAWACDKNVGDQKCTAVSQGTGGPSANFYSPFAVNHRPGFTALAGETPVDPGAIIGISASSTDADSAGSDWVQLYVCWNASTTVSGWGASGTCGSGGTLCSASSTANPGCDYTASSTLPDTTYNYYGYIVDNHSFPAAATSPASFVINNKGPTVSNVKLNNDASIDLTEETTYDVYLTATLNDENSCNDLSSGVGKSYRTASSSFCTAQNDNFCYWNYSCNIGPCGGAADADATTSCTITYWYYADPTFGAVNFAADTWTGWVQATDNNSATSSGTSATVEVNGLLALDVNTGTINYGSLAGGQQTEPLNVTSTLAETGNVSLDLLSTSTDMTGAGTIVVTYQRYSLAPSTAYAAGTNASTTDQELELNLAKTTASSTQATSSVYWGLLVPGGTPTGAYSGYTKYEAKLNETPW